MKQKTFEQKFWERVNKTDYCWEWTGAKYRYGYGKVMFNGKRVTTHRVSWELYYGKKPKLCILHHCDNPPCVNPHHLFEGTKAENNHDKFLKGRVAKGLSHGRYTKPWRTARGEKIGNSVTNEKTVRRIRKLYVPKRGSLVELSNRFDLPKSTIFNIVSRRTWKHVDDNRSSTAPKTPTVSAV